MYYQIQFKIKTKTFTLDLESDSYSSILDFFSDISACEVTEIRQYKYLNKIFRKDDGNYIDSVTVTLEGDLSNVSFKIPKVKRNLNDELFSIILNNLLINNKKPKNVKLKFNYKYTIQ